MHHRLVETCGRGIRIRQLGGSRAGEMRITRFLRNEKVSPDNIFAAAAEGCAGRVRGVHVLAIQDTTSLRDDGAGKSIVAHPVLAVCAETGAVLGLADCAILARDGDLASSRKTRPVAERQSRRWLDGARAGAALRAAGAARVTVAADRESDIYELFAAKPDGADLLVRANHDRDLDTDEKLFARLGAQPLAGEFEIALAAAPGRAARKAMIELRFCTATVRRPQRADKDLPETIDVWAVEALERDPPDGKSPAHWRLLTTHKVENAAQARWIAGLYAKRWIIEEFFRTLKTKGFDIENVNVEDEPFETLAAAAIVAATSVLALVQERDGKAKRPLEDVFHAADAPAIISTCARLEGKTAKQKNPHPKGSLAYAAWVCARLGGWTGYYGKPGPIVMLHGLHQLRAIILGWSIAHDV